MAGVSDAPFRAICQQMGAALTTSEMLTSDTRLWQSRKSSNRLVTQSGEQLVPRSIQIAGNDPQMMANAARECVAMGAELVDINMGCPAKKVCKKAAGSALLRDEQLVEAILDAVVTAVDIPVTLKIRTGWCPDTRNGTTIAKIAEQSGIQALTVHGRTRACRFTGHAEYQTIADIVSSVSIPVIANGDIDSPEKAKTVLQHTGASAVMVGRSVQGNPWLIRAIDQYLTSGSPSSSPTLTEMQEVMTEHLSGLYQCYGDRQGPRIARKHVKWYLEGMAERHPSLSNREYLKTFNTMESASEQLASVQHYLERLKTREELAA